MKSIISIFTLLLLLSFSVNAQSPSLTGKKWIVAEYGVADNINFGVDPLIKPLVIFFSKDSASNKIDYSNIEMHFFANGTYQAKNISGKQYNGVWNMNAAGDSLTTDSIEYKFNFIDEFNCITYNATIQVIDSIGTLDTLYSYVKLFGTPDITSIKEDGTSAVKLYPMPVKESLTIELPSGNYQEARLYNLFGQLLKTISLQNKSAAFVIGMQEFAPGYYSLEIIDNKGERTVKKVVKE